MPEQPKGGMQCAQFDALLSEALDGTLQGQSLAEFQAHAASCAVCGPLLAEAEAGQNFLQSLTEVDPPADLVRNIIEATSGTRPSLWERFVSTFITPVVAVSRQPRFAMSFGMAFFSLSVTLSLAGVKLSDLRSVDLHPAAIKRTYYRTTGKVVKYYENIRFVYEVESRVRELKRVTSPAPRNEEKKNNDRKDNSSGQPDQKQERNYSQGETQPVLASAPVLPPVADRRLS
jgi:hypothetical protein